MLLNNVDLQDPVTHFEVWYCWHKNGITLWVLNHDQCVKMMGSARQAQGTDGLLQWSPSSTAGIFHSFPSLTSDLHSCGSALSVHAVISWFPFLRRWQFTSVMLFPGGDSWSIWVSAEVSLFSSSHHCPGLVPRCPLSLPRMPSDQESDLQFCRVVIERRSCSLQSGKWGSRGCVM